jgi:tetratricopeptide (TPR) repeat protein
LTRSSVSSDNRGVRRALLIAALALGLPSLAMAQDAAATPAEPPSEAMERFADAQQLFERGDHSAALAEMERIYQLLEGTPNQYVVLYNLARVYEELFQYDRAIQMYTRYLADAPADASDRSDAEASLRALERLLGTIVIRTNATDVHVWVGDSDVGVAPGELRINAGHQVLELRAPGYESVRREIDLAARSRLELDIPMHALSDFHGLDLGIFAGTAAAAGAALLAGVGVGVAAMVMSSDAGSCVDRMGCSIDIPGTRQTIRDYALAADVLYGVTGALAITSLVLAFLTDWGGRETPPTSASVTIAPTPTGVVVGGQF